MSVSFMLKHHNFVGAVTVRDITLHFNTYISAYCLQEAVLDTSQNVYDFTMICTTTYLYIGLLCINDLHTLDNYMEMTVLPGTWTAWPSLISPRLPFVAAGLGALEEGREPLGDHGA